MSSLQNAVYQSIYEQIKDSSKVSEMLPDMNPYQMVDHHKKKTRKIGYLNVIHIIEWMKLRKLILIFKIVHKSRRRCRIQYH